MTTESGRKLEGRSTSRQKAEVQDVVRYCYKLYERCAVLLLCFAITCNQRIHAICL